MSVTAIIQGATGPGAVITAGSTIRVTVSPFGTSSGGGAPSAHASTHASGGSDPVSLAASQITSGVIAAARLGQGTADAGHVLLGDGTWSTAATINVASAGQLLDSADDSCALRYDSSGGGWNGNATSLTDLRTAIGAATTSHVHGSVTTDGRIGTTANLLVGTGTGGTLGTVSLGTGLTLSSGTVSANVTSVAGRTGAVTIASDDVSGLAAVATAGTFASLSGKPTTLAGYGITDAATSLHGHGLITTAGCIGSTSGLPIITTTYGVLTTGAFGSGAGQFCQGNDSRLTDSRAPNGSAGGDLTGTYPSPTLAAAGTSGTYTKVTTDTKGRVTSGTTLTLSDMPTDVQNATRLYLWSSFR